jgi:hypothetical protein
VGLRTGRAGCARSGHHIVQLLHSKQTPGITQLCADQRRSGLDCVLPVRLSVGAEVCPPPSAGMVGNQSVAALPNAHAAARRDLPAWK